MAGRGTIRDGRPGDGEGCAGAWADAGRYIYELSPDLGQVPDRVGLVGWFERSLTRTREPNEVLLVADDDGRVAGFVEATVEPPSESARWQVQRDLGLHRLVIGMLAVDETHRRTGVGTALMEAAEERGRSLGAVVALTDTNIRRGMSLPFYEDRMGYDRRAAILRKVL